MIPEEGVGGRGGREKRTGKRKKKYCSQVGHFVSVRKHANRKKKEKK